MRAVAEVPVVNEDQLRRVTTFLGELALILSRLGYARLKSRDDAERLQESEKRFCNVLETVTLMGVMLDRSGAIIMCNDFLLNLTGWSREDVVGRSWFEVFLPPEIRNDVQNAMFLKSIKAAECSTFVNEIVTRSGERRLVSWTNAVLRDSEGLVTSIASIGEDITEKKREEEQLVRTLAELKDANLRLNLAQTAAHAGLWTWNIVTGKIEWTSQMFSLFGLDPNKVKASFDAWKTALHPQDAAIAVIRIERAILDRTTLNSDYRIVMPDGQVRWINATGETLYSEQGHPREMLGICVDITGRKLAEERGRDLQVKLDRAARMESLGVMAGGVAHDLNNVLGPIVVLPEIVVDYVKRHGDPADPEYAETLESLKTMEASALRAKAVVSDLVVMGRRGQIRKEPLDVNRVVEQMLASQQIMAIQNYRPDVKITKILSAGPVTCLGSDSRLVRVLVNLVGNAEESIVGSGDIVIRTGRRVFTEPYHGYYTDVPAGSYVAIDVEDTGCGMNEGVLSRIFEPFFSTKAPGERSGSGLGLSVVYGLVRDHDGYFDVRSEPGKGTIFSVFLPFVDSVVGLPVPAAARMQGGTERILVVDDEPGQQVLARRALRKLGYAVTVVSSGEEAVQLFEQAGQARRAAPFDLVMTDLVMAGMGGLAVCQTILASYPAQKLIIVSGHSEEGKAKQAKSVGADWLVKP